MTAPVRVKICGITSHADAMAAVDAGAELLGFNFYARSPRCVDVATVKDITRDLPESARTVGVFVDAPRDEVHSIAEEAGLQLLQFHGHESVDYCKDWPLPVIKALRVRDQKAAEEARRYDVEFILADAYVEGQLGGTGQRLAPELLAGFDKRRLILAGGLNPDNVAEAVRLVRPYAVDVASGVESSPGRKDAELMRRFVRNVQSA